MWTKEVAKVWTNYIAPCRPSRFELEACSNLISNSREKFFRRPRILILGSTTEFRELCHEEWCETAIVDNSLEYHIAISQELKYKNLEEELIVQNWQSIDFESRFDFIVGDLVIGNLEPTEVLDFLRRVKKALADGGYFLTKSFFLQDDAKIELPKDFFREYERSFTHLDPFAFNIYRLVTYCVNKTNYKLKFGDMFREVEACFKSGVISKTTWDRFSNLGWEAALKTDFYVMPRREWEGVLTDVFSTFAVEFGNYFWSDDFPFYVIKK